MIRTTSSASRLFLCLALALPTAGTLRAIEHGPTTGELSILRDDTSKLPLADVEIVWFSQEELDRYREAGRQLGAEMAARVEAKNAAFSQLHRLSGQLVPALRQDMENAQQRTRAINVLTETFLAQNGDAVAKVNALKIAQTAARQEARKLLETDVTQLQSTRAALIQSQRDLASQHGERVIALLKRFTANRSLNYAEVVRVDDPALILNYITFAEAETGKYDFHLRKAYSFAQRKVYFPGIYAKIHAFGAERAELHQLFGNFLDAKTAMDRRVMKETPALNEEIRKKQFEISRLDELPYDIPDDLSDQYRALESLRQQRDVATRDSARLHAIETSIERDAFSQIPWTEATRPEALKLMAVLDEDVPSTGGRRLQELVSELDAARRKAESRSIRTGPDGGFLLPSNARAVSVFYFNTAQVPRKTFAWMEFTRVAGKPLMLSHANCIESVYLTGDQCVRGLILTATTVGFQAEFDVNANTRSASSL